MVETISDTILLPISFEARAAMADSSAACTHLPAILVAPTSIRTFLLKPASENNIGYRWLLKFLHLDESANSISSFSPSLFKLCLFNHLNWEIAGGNLIYCYSLLVCLWKWNFVRRKCIKKREEWNKNIVMKDGSMLNYPRFTDIPLASLRSRFILVLYLHQ